MADIFDEIKDIPKTDNSSGDVFDAIIPEDNATSTPMQDVSGVVGGTALMGGAGYGLYRAGRGVKDWWQKPQKLLAPIEEQFKIWQSENTNLSGTRPEDFPKFIQREITGVQRRGQQQIKDWKFETDNTVANLKNELSNFDTKILRTDAENLASTIKEGYPNVLKSGGKNYGASLKSIGRAMEKAGIKFTDLEFEQGVIDKALAIASKQNLPEANLATLTSLKQSLAEKGAEKSLRGAGSSPIKLGGMKSAVSNVINKNPSSHVSTLLRETWGDFLESKAPGEATQGSFKGALTRLNKEFKPFAQARYALSRVINPATGEFDTQGLYKMLSDYVKDNQNKSMESIQNKLKFLGEGSQLTSPIKGVKRGVENLGKLKETRGAIKETIPVIQRSGKINIKQISDSIANDVEGLLAWKQKAEELISKRKAIIEKYPARAKGLKRAGTYIGENVATRGIGRILFPFMGVAPQLSQFLNYQSQLNEIKKQGGRGYIDAFGQLHPSSDLPMI